MSVYFIRQGVTGNVKIGSTADIAQRVRGLQTGHSPRLLVMRLFAGDKPEERILHRRFADQALGGEWFRFHKDMLGDIGLPELKVPEIGRYAHNHNWPDTARGYESRLHNEILIIIGGVDELARRCGLPPWEAYAWRIKDLAWSGVMVMLGERGRQDITREMLVAARAATAAELAAQQKDEALREIIREESLWLRKHDGGVPWWTVNEANRHLLKPAVANISLVPAGAAE